MFKVKDAALSANCIERIVSITVQFYIKFLGYDIPFEAPILLTPTTSPDGFGPLIPKKDLSGNSVHISSYHYDIKYSCQGTITTEGGDEIVPWEY